MRLRPQAEAQVHCFTSRQDSARRADAARRRGLCVRLHHRPGDPAPSSLSHGRVGGHRWHASLAVLHADAAPRARAAALRRERRGLGTDPLAPAARRAVTRTRTRTRTQTRTRTLTRCADVGLGLPERTFALIFTYAMLADFAYALVRGRATARVRVRLIACP